jgi:hypothetical protein
MDNLTSLIKAVTIVAGILSLLTPVGQTKGATITVNADQVLHTNSRNLTGACIEDVNHEIYGGIDSQMIFGESFAEPAAQLPLKGFKAYEGRWTLADDGSVQGVGSNGSKIVWDGPALSVGEVSVDVKLTGATMAQQIQPIQKHWQPIFNNDAAKYDFQPHSITVLKFK